MTGSAWCAVDYNTTVDDYIINELNHILAGAPSRRETIITSILTKHVQEMPRKPVDDKQ